MKKIFALAMALVLVVGLAACSPIDNVPTLEAVKEYSTDDFNEHFKGLNREGLIEVWGEPTGSLQEENADMWDIDDESLVVIYWKDNGVFKSAGVCIKDELTYGSDHDPNADNSKYVISGNINEFQNESESKIAEFSIFAHTDIVSAIKNDIPEVPDSWTDADNPVINYEHIVSIYTPENFSQNDSTFSDTLAFSNRYIVPAVSDGKCIGAFFISQYEGKWVIDTYIVGLDIESAIKQHKDSALCFVSIPQFGVEQGFLTKNDTGEVYTSISATFDKISSGEELLNRLLKKNSQNNGEMTEG